MLLFRTEKLPESPRWLVELKFDGYRVLAIKDSGKVRLRSRNDKDCKGSAPKMVTLWELTGRTTSSGVPRYALGNVSI
jgi:ATP-dependent DNA ligase